MTILKHGRRLILAAGLVLAAGSTASAAGQTVEPPTDPLVSSATSPEADGVRAIVTAAEVAAWGRAHGDPGALIMAARILAEIPVRPASDQSGAALVTPDIWLDEAAALSAGNQGVLDAIDRLRGGNRGVRTSAFGAGPIFTVREIKARETYGFDVEARGGEVLRVAAIGDGDTDIDISVRDAAGRLVCRDGYGDHYPVCTLAPAHAGKMRVEIVNRGAVWTKVQILSN